MIGIGILVVVVLLTMAKVICYEPYHAKYEYLNEMQDRRIDLYLRAKTQLLAELGREPTVGEMYDRAWALDGR